MTGELTPPAPLRASDPLTYALYSTSFGCLIVAFLYVESVQLAQPSSRLWLGLVVLILMALLLYRLASAPNTENAIAYLLGGGLAVGMLAAVMMDETRVAEGSDAFPYMLAKVALLFGGRSSLGWFEASAWPLAAFVVGESVVAIAARSTGGQYTLDTITLIALIAVISARTFGAALDRPNVGVRASLRRASLEENAAMARARAEVNASALLHDTVLKDLAALAAAGPTRLDDRLARRLRLDLELLANGRWATAGVAVTTISTDLDAIVTAVREHGLTVDVTGDGSAIATLSAAQRSALALAVYQCLINVSEHSGTTSAEITLAHTDDMMSVMVVDSGRGFRVGETAGNRLGLRQSVLRRMEDVGGTARVWSAPGRGTAVQLMFPRVAAS